MLLVDTARWTRSVDFWPAGIDSQIHTCWLVTYESLVKLNQSALPFRVLLALHYII